jgi:hypothetical protein
VAQSRRNGLGHVPRLNGRLIVGVPLALALVVVLESRAMRQCSPEAPYTTVRRHSAAGVLIASCCLLVE